MILFETLDLGFVDHLLLAGNLHLISKYVHNKYIKAHHYWPYVCVSVCVCVCVCGGVVVVVVVVVLLLVGLCWGVGCPSKTGKRLHAMASHGLKYELQWFHWLGANNHLSNPPMHHKIWNNRIYQYLGAPCWTAVSSWSAPLRQPVVGAHRSPNAEYRQLFNISRTRSQILNVRCLVLQLFLFNPSKLGIGPRMKI